MSWTRGGGDGGARAVAWDDGQHLSRGWLRARLPAYFIVRKSEPRRERVNLRGQSGGEGQTTPRLEAVNGLGVDLESLSVADATGRVYLPVYDTVYRPVHLPQPDGYDVTYSHSEGWFKVPTKLGTLTATVIPAGTP